MLFPEAETTLLSEKLPLPLSETERLEILSSWLKPDEKERAKDFLLTLETLRNTIILNKDHAEFLFSELPLTPLNLKIRVLLLRYLDSQLSQDLTAATWTLIETIKNQSHTGFDEVHVVTTPDSSLVFLELAKNLKTRAFSAPLRGVYPKSSPLIHYDNPTAILHQLTEEVRTHVTRTGKNAVLPFAGSPAELLYLKCRLQSYNLLAQIPIVPYWLIPPVDTFRSFLFVGAHALERERTGFLLNPHHLEHLGFSNPRARSPRELLGEVVAALSYEGSPHNVYFSLDPELVLNVPFQIQTRIAGSPSVPTESYHVPIPRRSFSATQLEQYALCPSKYFFSQVLKLREPEDPQALFPLWLGQTVHHVLEETFKQPTPSLDLPDLTKSFERSLATLFPVESQKPPWNTLLTRAGNQCLSQVDRLEQFLKQLFPNLTPRYFERSFEFRLGDTLFTGKIDRIDESSQGVLLLDYKTGNVDFSPNHIVQGENFQTLLYLLVAETLFPGRVMGFLFYDLKKGELRRGLLKEEFLSKESARLLTRGHTVSSERYHELLELGKTHIAAIVASILQGNFTPTPSILVCRSCPYDRLCRKSSHYV